MRRTAINVLTVVSLLLCPAMVALWASLPRRRPVYSYTAAHRYAAHWTPDSVWLEVTAGTRDARGAFRAPPGRGWDSSWLLREAPPA